MSRRRRRSYSRSPSSPRRDRPHRRRRRNSSYDDDRFDRRRRRNYRRSRSRENYRNGSRHHRSPEKYTPCPFRPRDLSRERCETNTTDFEYPLKDAEVAYVFGKQGSTKDKLARVSGTKMDLNGTNLVIRGDKASIERAKRYIQILLDQRDGEVIFDTSLEGGEDVTYLDIPNDCKGFVTGRGGETLRQIERECATLMTFCKVQDYERLAIFGTPRGRLTAMLKVMSVVEGKHAGFYIKNGGTPEVNIPQSDVDKMGDGWGVDFMELDQDILGYALGKRGDTRMKLEIASDCIIQYIGNWATFGGKRAEQLRGKTFLTWLLNQRKSDFVVPNIEGRDDVSVLYVPESSVGYVTGIKAKTLRGLENKTGTFCFFDRRSGRDKEKMLIFAARSENREKACDEVRSIVSFHQRKIGGRGRVSSYPTSSVSESRSPGGSVSRSHSAMSEN